MYYYCPRADTIFKDIIPARNWVMQQEGGKLITRLHVENYNRITNDIWCKKNPKQAAMFLDLIQIYTPYKLEAKIHVTIYQLIQRCAAFTECME